MKPFSDETYVVIQCKTHESPSPVIIKTHTHTNEHLGEYLEC